MNMKLKKAFSDLLISPKRTFLVVFALILGIWGVGTVLISYSILTNDLSANYQSTIPAQVIFHSKDFDKMDLKQFIKRPEVETAELRDFSLQRIEVHPNEWIPIWLYGVENFNKFNMARIFREVGPMVPDSGTMLMERDGRHVSDIHIGDAPRVRIGGKTVRIPVTGICFDPAQAPSTQDAFIYAYTDKKSFSKITGLPSNERLIARLNNVHSQEEVKKVADALTKDLTSKGVVISSIEVPKFNQHPHQWQLNTLLFLIGTIGLLAFIMGAVLVSQLMKAIMASQVRQIGILKAVGASQYQVFLIYIIMLLIMGLSAGVLAIPLSVSTGKAFSYFVAGKLNFNILTTTVSFQIYGWLIAASLLLPIILSVSTLFKGTGISVREALSDYGISQNIKAAELKFLQKIGSSMFILAVRNSLRNSRRLVVTILAMALGVAIFSTGFNVRQSLWNLLSGLKQELRYDVQVVLNQQIPREDALRPFKSLENVKVIEMWNGGRGEIQSKVLSTDKGAGIVALPYNTDLLKVKIKNGSWLKKPSNEVEIVMNQQAWDLYHQPKVGSLVALTFRDRNFQTRLVGIAEQFEKPKVYMDQNQFDSMFNPDHLINSLMFVASDNNYDKVIELKKDIENAIVPTDFNVLYVMSQAERVKIIYDHLNIILSTIVILSFLVLVVSAIGMASAMGINIWERTREIGVMRAIGATPKKIYSIFLNEGMIVSTLSVLLGLLLAIPLSKLAAIFFGNLMLGKEMVLQYAFSTLGFWITLVVTVLFGWLASRFPARSAIKLPTHKALSYE
jgi:putative ABC transport system permease protein